MVRFDPRAARALVVRERGCEEAWCSEVRGARSSRPVGGEAVLASSPAGPCDPAHGADLGRDAGALQAPGDGADRPAVRKPTSEENASQRPAGRKQMFCPRHPGPRQPQGDPRGPVPDPFEDADALDELGDEIATLAAHIHAATHRMLVLLADFDRRRGWELGGHRSCAHWLSVRTGIDLGAAREKVRAARVLAGLPETGAAMARGELSFSQVRALTRAATPENEGDLLELARGCTTSELERVVRAWKKGSRRDEAARERERYLSRTLSVFPDDEGMYLVKGRLPAEVGALLMRAVEAASDALFREKRAPWEEEESREEAARRRADALGLLAQRALWAGFGGREVAPETEESARTETGEPATTIPVPVSGTRAERYQVVIHVDPQTLQADTEPGRSELQDGTRVSAETVRRLCCDCGVVPLLEATDGSILNVGRKTRTLPPALRRALEARDRGCRFPGCGLRFTDGHHVKHWADGGETSLANCVLLCDVHHRLVHEGGWTMDWWGAGRPVFYDPRGQAHYDGRWEPPHLGVDPVEALVHHNRIHGIDPDARTAGARWRRADDIPDRVHFAALEALA